MNPTIITSLFFSLPIFLFNPNTYISCLLYMTTTSSILFWSNPVKNSIIHKIDACIARLTIATFIFYKIYLNTCNQLFFFTTMMKMFFFFYMSNVHSKKCWCGHNHLFFHTFAHIYAVLAICIALW